MKTGEPIELKGPRSGWEIALAVRRKHWQYFLGVAAVVETRG